MSEPLDMVRNRTGSIDSQEPIAIGGALAMSAAPFCARFSLRIEPADLPGLAPAFGAGLPVKIGATTIGQRTALCLGPNEWLLLVPEAESLGLVADFAKACLKVHYSLVDVSHRTVGIDLAGPRAAFVLGAGCPLDLGELPAGGCARTVFDQVEIVVLKYGAEQYRIEIVRSFAPFVWDSLATAAREPV